MEFNPHGLFLQRVGNGSASRFLHFASKNCMVGRHESCDIVIKGSSRIVSRRQCRLYFENSRLFIENVSKSNYTFINADRVLQKTEVEVDDLIGLGTSPYNHISNGIISDEERFIYKCCAPIQISDDEDAATEVLSSNSGELQDRHISNNNAKESSKVQTKDFCLQFPSLTNIQQQNSPEFSSDTSLIDNNARDVINRILEAPEENSHSDNESCTSHISLKGARVVLKKLSEAEIKKYCHDASPTKSSSSSSHTKNSKKQSNVEKVELPPSVKDLTFSRSKYEHIEKAKQIKRRISQFVDAEESENDDQESRIEQPKTTNGVRNKNIERAKKSSRSSSESSSSRKSHSSSRDKKLDNDKNRSKEEQQQPSKKRKISENENSKLNKDRIHMDRKLENRESISKEREPTTSEIVEKKSPSKEKFAFPALNNNEKLAIVSKKITARRHTTHTPIPKQMVLIERSETKESPRTPSNASKNLETKCLNRLAKRLKSVGDSQKASTFVIPEERKKKLKELNQKKPENLPEKESAEVAKSSVKATTSNAPIKVKVTSNNRGKYLTQDLPKARCSTTNNASKKPSETSATVTKSAVSNFYGPISSENGVDDPTINIEVPPPTRGFFNQPIETETGAISTINPPSFSQPSFGITIEDIPTVPYAPTDPAPIIYESEQKSKNGLVSILTSAHRRVKKNIRVRFKSANELESIRLLPSILPEPSLSQTYIQRKILKDLELNVCDDILSWNIQWLKELELPGTWKNVPMKNSYESIDEYKGILKGLMRIEVLSKLKSSNKTQGQSNSSEKEFAAFTVIQSRKQGANHHYQLELSTHNNPKYFYRGMLIVLKIRDASKTDIDFFGYVSEVKNTDKNSAAFVEIIYKELPLNLSVVKCKSLMYIRNDIKSFVAVENIQDEPIIHHIINPENNKLKSNWSTDLKISAELDDDQKKIVNVITSDCLNNRKEANVIALQSKAGTGKTRILIESIISIINCSKRDGVKFSILVCAMSNFCVDEIATQTNNHPAKKKNAKLARHGPTDKMSSEAKKLSVSDLKALKDVDVIFTTVNSAYDIYNYKKDFDVCFIDDANCCLDSELVILMQLNITKLFLIGDIYQTQRMAQSEDLLDSKYDETFFARMIHTFKDKPEEEKPILELTTQHRMSNELADILDGFIYSENSFSSKVDNNLVPSNQLADLSMKPFLVISIEEENMDKNLLNLSLLGEEIYSNLPKWQQEKDVNTSIGVIIRTTKQRDKIQTELKKYYDRIEVYSIDNIQGIQKDIIILLIADCKDIIYLSCLNRLNNVMTRARRAFYIAVPSHILKTPTKDCSKWNKLIEHAKTNDQVKVISKDHERENQYWW